MTDDHKAALAEGRAEGHTVKNYLELLAETRPKRGRKRTRENIEARLTQINEDWDGASALKRLSLTQERLDLTEELGAMAETVDISEAEAAFVQIARSYSGRKGISYAAWRENGVPADVLRKAGITRGS